MSILGRLFIMCSANKDLQLVTLALINFIANWCIKYWAKLHIRVGSLSHIIWVRVPKYFIKFFIKEL